MLCASVCVCVSLTRTLTHVHNSAHVCPYHVPRVCTTSVPTANSKDAHVLPMAHLHHSNPNQQQSHNISGTGLPLLESSPSPPPPQPLLWENSYSEGFILLFEGGFLFLVGFTLPLPQEGFIPPFHDNSQF